MGNSWFQMKAFTVHQPNTTLKVSTEACLFGAWVADRWQKKSPHINRLLDIGTGTGLLSLMLAQQIPAEIDAVEIDPQAVMDASLNFSSSPWQASIHLHHTDLKDFAAPTAYYQGIICNPPFFTNDLKSPDEKKNTAKHEINLPLRLIIEKSAEWLAPGGQIALLLPAYRAQTVEDVFEEANWFIAEKAAIHQSNRHDVFRQFYLLQREPTLCKLDRIVIKESQTDYSEEAARLLKPYYLYL
jgi:tRNA1Val (adenine37-N6)-methyltransferase